MGLRRQLGNGMGGAEMDRKYMAIEHLADERLRAARRERGMTQIDVADQMTELGFPWSQPTVARVERGRRRLSLAQAHALMDILTRAAFIAGLIHFSPRPTSGLRRLPN